MQHINKIFQSSTGDSTKLLNDIIFAINSLKSKIIPENVNIDILKNDFEHLVKHDCYLGYAFETKLKECKENISNDIEAEIRSKCVNFIIALINELKQRLPDNFEVFQQIDLFSITKILCPKKANILHILEHLKLDSDKIEDILFQYQNIHLLNWSNLTDTISFWAEVSNYVDAAGNKRFSALASFALSLLSMPWSNAEVERVFSQMNNVKTKLRNRMAVETLNSILHIRYGLRRANKSCHNYEVPQDCLKMIGTNQSYKNSAEEEGMIEEISELLKNT
ncbi:uncharacterized protein LOC133849197 isoform X1 [Drosophila sulfurigaster albostrigata]|uniref:uncharacterized protein LOC133849197 isoform X1 n=1 Tax=Drosophila sulfurigaster albostrigata TaxID=89887 RepID=UPI002D21E8AC|nr:uncharacterized protein LOC133849197 isoform X1 [Drosophila sulfurigaster albostrigata]